MLVVSDRPLDVQHRSHSPAAAKQDPHPGVYRSAYLLHRHLCPPKPVRMQRHEPQHDRCRDHVPHQPDVVSAFEVAQTRLRFRHPETVPDPEANRAEWVRWQAGLKLKPTLPMQLPILRMLLVLDNPAGHKTASFVLWLFSLGILAQPGREHPAGFEGVQIRSPGATTDPPQGLWL